jgi:hypothetical protein
LLSKFQTGLSQVVREMLAEDCARSGERSLGADLACGTLARSEAALAVIEYRRANTEQLERLRPLALQLAALPNGSWYLEARLPIDLFYPLVALTGGLDGVFAQRLQMLGSEKAWAYFREDYLDTAEEPLARTLAEQAVVGIPALLDGQPWPFSEDQALDREDLDQEC